MPFGSPGDSPLTDLLEHNLKSVYPEDITLMLKRLKKEHPMEIVKLPKEATNWDQHEKTEEGRLWLYEALERNGIETEYYRSLTKPKIESKEKIWEFWK